MVHIKKYHLPPTELIPNSPLPLLHYTGLQLPSTDTPATAFHDLLTSNGWKTSWIFRYGTTQRSHYHSKAHECMAVLSGTATIRFGVADTSSNMDDNTEGNAHEEGGIEVEAQAGDVFILPAGTAHKTFHTKPDAEFALLTPGDGHGIAADDARKALEEVKLDGFTMLGAYPMKGSEWDFREGGEDVGAFDRIWDVEKPERDPILGKAEEGLCGLWQ